MCLNDIIRLKMVTDEKIIKQVVELKYFGNRIL